MSADKVDRMLICSTSMEKEPLNHFESTLYTVDPTLQPSWLAYYSPSLAMDQETSQTPRARRCTRPKPKVAGTGHDDIVLLSACPVPGAAQGDGARPKREKKKR